MLTGLVTSKLACCDFPGGQRVCTSLITVAMAGAAAGGGLVFRCPSRISGGVRGVEKIRDHARLCTQAVKSLEAQLGYLKKGYLSLRLSES